MMLGFAGSNPNEFIGSFFFGRDSFGTSSTRPVLIHGGQAYSHSFQWGHYTGATADTDGTFWTVQEYAEKGTADQTLIGTRITKIRTN